MMGRMTLPSFPHFKSEKGPFRLLGEREGTQQLYVTHGRDMAGVVSFRLREATVPSS